MATKRKAKKKGKRKLTPKKGLVGKAAKALSGRAGRLAAQERKALGGK